MNLNDLFSDELSLDGDLYNRRGHVGYIALAGRPNVGKSTLINSILGYHLAAVSSRPQTTRKHWKGFYTDDDAQLVFTDTPGIHEPNDKLGSSMKTVITQHVKESDIVVCIVDASRDHLEEDEMVIKTLNELAEKIVLVINKVDVSTPEQVVESREFFTTAITKEILGVVEICAKSGNGVDELLSLLKSSLPVMPFLYDPDEITDVYERDIVTELIQESLFTILRKEIPHGTVVKIDKWKEDAKKIKINATVHTDRQAHKKILIGANGEQLNEIRRLAVKNIRENIDKRIDLDLFVKVSPEWRNRKSMLDEFGFGNNK